MGVAIDFELLPTPAAPSPFPAELSLKIYPAASALPEYHQLAAASAAHEPLSHSADTQQNNNSDASISSSGKSSGDPPAQPESRVTPQGVAEGQPIPAAREGPEANVFDASAEPAASRPSPRADASEYALAAAVDNDNISHMQRGQKEADDSKMAAVHVVPVESSESARVSQEQPGARGQSTMWMGRGGR